MYSKLEKVPDALVDDYLTLLTGLDLSQLPANPRERQKAMALEVTRQRHGAADHPQEADSQYASHELILAANYRLKESSQRP